MALSETKAVISFAQRVNFGLMTTFNICFLFDPIFIKNVSDAVIDSGGVYTSGFIHQKGYPNSRGECNASHCVPETVFIFIITLKLFCLRFSAACQIHHSLPRLSLAHFEENCVGTFIFF